MKSHFYPSNKSTPLYWDIMLSQENRNLVVTAKANCNDGCKLCNWNKPLPPPPTIKQVPSKKKQLRARPSCKSNKKKKQQLQQDQTVSIVSFFQWLVLPVIASQFIWGTFSYQVRPATPATAQEREETFKKEEEEPSFPHLFFWFWQ